MAFESDAQRDAQTGAVSGPNLPSAVAGSRRKRNLQLPNTVAVGRKKSPVDDASGGVRLVDPIRIELKGDEPKPSELK